MNADGWSRKITITGWIRGRCYEEAMRGAAQGCNWFVGGGDGHGGQSYEDDAHGLSRIAETLDRQAAVVVRSTHAATLLKRPNAA